MSDFIKELIKKDGWYRGKRKHTPGHFGFHHEGLGDLIYNNLRRIIEDDDKSKWAQEIFDKCTMLMIEGKRWPDKLEPNRGKLRKEGYPKYRSQYSMTRDPWVMYYAACIHFDKRPFLRLKPPFWLYRPTLWELRKALNGRKNSYKFWRRISDFNKKKKDYVKWLDHYMDWSYERK